jgi:hypothetical protein
MNFLGSMIGVMDSTEEQRKGFAKYNYDAKKYPFEEESLAEGAFWSFAQGAASVVHGKENDMYARIKHNKDKVIIESRRKEDWNTETSLF